MGNLEVLWVLEVVMRFLVLVGSLEWLCFQHVFLALKSRMKLLFVLLPLVFSGIIEHRKHQHGRTPHAHRCRRASYISTRLIHHTRIAGSSRSQNPCPHDLLYWPPAPLAPSPTILRSSHSLVNSRPRTPRSLTRSRQHWTRAARGVMVPSVWMRSSNLLLGVGRIRG